MISIGLYTKKEKENPSRQMLSFYSRIGTYEIPEFKESFEHIFDGVKTTFVFDKEFSKEVGHYAYVKSGEVITPFTGE